MRNNLKHFAYCVYCGLQSITGFWERRFQQIMDNLHGKTASTSSVHKQLKNNLKNRLSFMSMDTRGSGHRFHSCETYMGNRMYNNINRAEYIKTGNATSPPFSPCADFRLLSNLAFARPLSAVTKSAFRAISSE